MIEFKNRLTGTLMAVAPEREAEYLAAGHTRVAPPAAAAPATEQRLLACEYSMIGARDP